MEYKHILGGTDFSAIGDLALRRAVELTLAAGCRLTAAHVVQEIASPSPLMAHYEATDGMSDRERAVEEARVTLADRIQEMAGGAEIEVEYEVRCGDPADEILVLDRQLQPDLIVIATHGRHGWRRLVMGSVAEQVVRLAKADVLAVRQQPDGE